MVCTTNERKTLVVPTPQWAWKVGLFVRTTFAAVKFQDFYNILKKQTEFIINTKIAFAATEPTHLQF